MGRVTWSSTKPSDAFLSALSVCPTCSTGSFPMHFGEWLGTRIVAVTGCPAPREGVGRQGRWLSFVMAATKRGRETTPRGPAPCVMSWRA